MGIAGTTSISATAAAIKGLSDEEVIAALTTTELTQEEMAAALVKAGYTNATALQTAELAAEAREQEIAAAATIEAAAADSTATAATTGLSVATTGLGNVFKGLWATLKANPIVWVLAGVAALIAAVDAYQKRVQAAEDKLHDSAEEVKNLQGEMDDLNGELKTTQNRIEELLRKPALTIVEQNELENLQRTNDELQRQLELKQRSAEVAQGKNADNFVNAVNTKQTQDGGNAWWFGYNNYGDFKTNPNKSEAHPNRPEANTTGVNHQQQYMFQWRLEDYQEAEAKYQAALEAGNEAEAKKWKERKDELNTAMSGYVSDMTGYLQDLGNYNYETLSDDAKAAIDYINDIQNAYLMTTGDSGNSVFSNIYNQGRFAEGKKAIDELRESGKLTADTFAELYNSNDSVKAMIDNMQKVGLINDTTASTFQNLTNQIVGTKEASEQAANVEIPFSELISSDGTQDTIDSFKDRLTTLSEALDDLQSGELSDSDLLDLIEKFPELANRTDDLDNALNELIGTTQQEVDNQFENWKKQMPTEEDAQALDVVRNAINRFGDSANGISRVKAEIEKLKDELNGLQSAYSDIKGVIDDYNENGYLTLDNLQSIMSLEPQYVNLLIDENGQINLNNAAYKEYVATKAKALLVDELKDLYSTVLNMKVEEAQAYANAEAYNAETRSVKDLLAATTELYLVKAKQKDSANNTTAYTDAIKRSFSTAANYAALVDSYINSLSTSQNEFSTATEQATSALEAQKDALEDEKDALQDAKEAWEDYRDALSDAQSDIQDLIDLVIEYIKQLKNDEMDALSDQIDALETQKDNYADIIAQKKEALELAKKEREEADKLADLQKAVAKDALALAVANLDDSSAGKKAQKQAHDNLLESNKNLQDELAEQEYDMRVSALEKDQEEYEAHIDKRIEKLNKEKDAIQEYLNNVRQLYEDACNMIDNDTGDLYGKLWNDYVYPYTTKTRAEFDNLWSKAQEAIQRYIGDNGTLIGVMEYLQGEIYVTDGKIEGLEGEIGRLESAIDITSRAIDDTATSINNVSSSIGGLGASLSEYMDLLNQVANQKKHHFNWNGEHYISYADNQSEALADIAGQIKARTGQDVAVYGPLAYYKKGTYGAKGGWNITQEGGISEDVFQKLRGGKFTYMTPDSHVFNGDATENLHEFMDSPKEYISRVMGQINYGDFMSSRAKENIKLMEREIANNSTSNLSNITMHFAPVTTIQGNADRDTINQMDKFYEKYKERFMLDILREKNNL